MPLVMKNKILGERGSNNSLSHSVVETSHSVEVKIHVNIILQYL